MKALAITILSVLAAFVASVIAVSFIAGWFGIWRTLAIGIVVAPVVVVVAYLTTEKRKALAAAITYAIGFGAAIYLLKNDYYPESYPRAYEPTLIPLFATITSGAVALLVLAITKRNNENEPNK